MSARETLGKNIRKQREHRKWSQEELAYQTGIHRTYISGLERGVRNPTLSIIENIANTLEIPVSQLLEETK